MKFCPLCFKMLMIQDSEQGNRLFCQQCRYYYPIVSEHKKVIKFAEDLKVEIIEQNQETKELPTIAINCEKCGSGHAYFEQRQTRSADEASTLFFTCVGCGHKWN